MTAPIDITPPPARSDRLLARLGGIAGGLGIALCVAGFVVIGLGWNGAAERVSLVQQVPYLISGGFFGLGLIVLGAGILVADSHRRDRAELAVRLEALIAAQQPVAGPGLSPDAEGFAPMPRVPAGR